jgi:hypothetical protein
VSSAIEHRRRRGVRRRRALAAALVVTACGVVAVAVLMWWLGETGSDARRGEAAASAHPGLEALRRAKEEVGDVDEDDPGVKGHASWTRIA